MELLLGFVIIWMGLLGFGHGDTFDVTKFGAIGDGNTDDSQAFLKAWGQACGASGSQNLQIPSGKTFLLRPLALNGPCKSNNIQLQLEGTLLIPSPSEWKPSQKDEWMSFRSVDGLTVVGSGKIDGRGEPWWKAGEHSPRPTSLAFHSCNNLQIKQITSMNTPRNHISIDGCTGPTICNVNLIAPEDSPNTDGIDIASSKEVNICDSFIGTGDDCVAMNGGNSGINITNVRCGPGHGISVGSLGGGGTKAMVENVRVQKCTFNRTQNGARIKTWPGGSGYAKNILFEDITLIEAGNPIMIDQHYGCRDKCPPGASAVELSDIKFIRVRGTSKVKNAIILDCSKAKGCNDVVLNHVNIKAGAKVKKLGVVCKNVHGTSSETVPRVPCLSG